MIPLSRLVLAAALLPTAALAQALPAVNPAEPPPLPPAGWVRESPHAWLRTDVPNSARAWKRMNANQWALVAPQGG